MILKAQALLQENEHILERENNKMKELYVRSNLLFDNLGTWHSRLDAVTEEFNQKSAITDEELRRQSLESVFKRWVFKRWR